MIPFAPSVVIPAVSIVGGGLAVLVFPVIVTVAVIVVLRINKADKEFVEKLKRGDYE